MSKTTKVRHLQIITPEEELENLRNEVGVLQRTVESKSAAVAILRAELQECQRERDKFRTIAEDETLHRSSKSSISKTPTYSDPCRSAMLSGSEGTLAQLLSISKEENKTLRLDCTELRCKLHDAQADIKVLREEMQRLRGTVDGRRRSLAVTANSQLAHQEREQFISQMESLSSKCQALEGDVRGLVEEREELVRELDASSHKIHRLNYILNTVLSSTSTSDVIQSKRIVDLDSIITENRYLQERLKQTEDEKNLIQSNASKYKNALEKCRTQGTMKLGTPENLIVTPKQVTELLRDYHGEVGGAAETDLKSLCVALVDALNQRSRALRTQRSANKVLANRISELERRLSCFGNSDNSKSPDGINNDDDVSKPQISSSTLMEGYILPSGPLPKYSEEMLMKDPRLLQLLKNGIGKDEVALKNDIPEEEVDLSNEENKDKMNSSHHRNSGHGYDIDMAKSSSVNSIQRSESRRKLQETENSQKSHCLSDSENKGCKSTTQKHSKVKNQVLNECDEKSPETPLLPNNTKHSSGLKRVSVKHRVNVSNKNPHTMITNAEQNIKQSSREVNKFDTRPEKVSTYVNPEDELEEIVPIDKLDCYMKEVQMKRKTMGKTSDDCNKSCSEKKVTDVTPEVNKSGEMENSLSIGKDSIHRNVENPSGVSLERPIDNVDDNDENSFDLDISDYDSDNDNLDLALQDWQNDFDKYCPGSKEKAKKIKKPKGPSNKPSGKEKFHFWQKDKPQEPKLSPALQEFLDKATADVEGEGM